MITVEQIRELAADLDNVNLTLHVQDRLGLRNIGNTAQLAANAFTIISESL